MGGLGFRGLGDAFWIFLDWFTPSIRVLWFELRVLQVCRLGFRLLGFKVVVSSCGAGVLIVLVVVIIL